MEGNEFSYFMLITSSFMLNDMEEPDQWTIFPWVNNSCNQLSDADQLRGVSWIRNKNFLLYISLQFNFLQR